MAFPKKFKHLLETEIGDVPSPDFVWLVYAVCAMTNDACGWGGWIIDSAFSYDENGEKNHQTITGDILLPAFTDQICPNCGRETFRTGATIRMIPSEDQQPFWVEGVNFESVPMEYED